MCVIRSQVNQRIDYISFLKIWARMSTNPKTTRLVIFLPYQVSYVPVRATELCSRGGRESDLSHPVRPRLRACHASLVSRYMRAQHTHDCMLPVCLRTHTAHAAHFSLPCSLRSTRCAATLRAQQRSSSSSQGRPRPFSGTRQFRIRPRSTIQLLPATHLNKA